MDQQIVNEIITDEDLDIDQLLSRFEAVLQLLDYAQLSHFQTVLAIGHPSKLILDDQELIDEIVLETIESGFDYDQLFTRFKILLLVCEDEQLLVIQKLFE